MKLTTQTSAAALKAATRAHHAAEQMESQAREAEGRISAMEAEAVDALVADPGQAQSITTAIDGQTRLVAAYRTKAAQHRAEAARALQSAAALDADELARAADAKTAEGEAAQARIDKLLTALEEYAGVSFEVAPASRDFTGEPTSWPSTVAEDLQDEGTLLRVQASSSRYYAEHAQAPQTLAELNTVPGANYSLSLTWGGRLDPSAHWSPLLRSLDAGAALTGEG